MVSTHIDGAGVQIHPVWWKKLEKSAPRGCAARVGALQGSPARFRETLRVRRLWETVTVGAIALEVSVALVRGTRIVASCARSLRFPAFRLAVSATGRARLQRPQSPTTLRGARWGLARKLRPVSRDASRPLPGYCSVASRGVRWATAQTCSGDTIPRTPIALRGAR